MGACQFENWWAGTDPAEAFRALREHALWENGHGGYSGTVAEKDSFVMVTPPEGIEPSRYVSWMQGSSEEEIVKTPASLKEAKRRGSYSRGVGDQCFVYDRRPIPPEFLPKLEKDRELVDDKWGPAGCMACERNGEPGFIFFGWASS